jgi:hypothetical protein
MNKETNTTEVVFSNFKAGYDQLPAISQTPVRLAIMKDCGWKTRATFHSKRKGYTRIKPNESSVIESHFRKHGINPYTGFPFFDENF